MSLFRRKPKKFNYAAIRIGNVYVLPPDEEDVREYRRERRKEITRRGFIVGGILVALGAVAVPFLPGKKNELDPKMLFDADLATANKTLLRNLCIAFHDHPSAAVRYEVARVMAAFPGDATIKGLLWKYVQNDSDFRVKCKAVDSIVQHAESKDIPNLADQYYRDASLQPTIDEAIDDYEWSALRRTIDSWMDR